MTPDVIVTWPWTCDYPLWRKFIRDERGRFAKVLVAFTTNTDGPNDYRAFVREQLGDIAECFDAPTDGEWRDRAVNAALDRSSAEWVWFTEQDFLVHNSVFWERVAEDEAEFSVIGTRDQTPRWHPSCLFVKRAVIDTTSRYFGPDPVDHFYTFSRELPVGMLMVDWFGATEHLQGLSYNHFLSDTNQPVTFHPERFRRYLRECLESGVPLDPRWAERAEREVLVTA